MAIQTPSDVFFGLFELRDSSGAARVTSSAQPPRHIPDPETGRPLKVASLEVSERGVCPACTQHGAGGYVSFVSDLRLAFACPTCLQLVWLAGA